MVGIIGFFNGFGCLIWVILFDYIGCFVIFSVIFIFDIVMFLVMFIFKLLFLFVIVLCLLMFCYGVGFFVILVYLGDVFGIKELGVIYGYVLIVWVVVGVVGLLLLLLIY